jgi:hypothetical protein
VITSNYTVIKSPKVDETARFFKTYFGFDRSFAADWYVSLRNGALELDVLDPDHESVPEAFRGASSPGVLLNFETDQVDDLFDRFLSDERKFISHFEMNRGGNGTSSPRIRTESRST